MASFTKITGIKFVELVLAIVLFILVLTQSGGYAAEHSFHFGTFMTYLIILIGVVGGAFSGTPVNRRIDLYFSLIGAILFIVVGITLFSNSHNTTITTTKGVLCIIEGVLFVIDGFFTFRGDA